MKRCLTLIITLMLAFVAGTVSHAGSVKQAPAQATAEPTTELAKTQGEVLKIDGRSYLVKDASGNQTLLTLDKDTKLEGTPKVGDKIEVELSSDGRLISLKVAP